jgi:malate permease and related proteins
VTLLTLAGTIVTFVVIVAIGALLRVTGLLHSGDARPLNNIIIYVGLPAFVFRAVHQATLSWSLFRVVAVAWVTFAVMLALSWGLARALRLPPTVAGAFILTSALGNTGYIGYPATAALLGEAAVPEAVFYDVFGTVFALVVVGLFVAQHYGAADDIDRVNPFREIVTFPAVIALVVALVLRPFAMPIVVSRGIDLCANLVAPLIMLAVGVSLRPGAVKGRGAALGTQAVLKLAVAPAVALAFGLLFVGPEPALRVAVLEASMPAMMLTLPIGGRFELDTDYIASAIFVSTAAAAITVPLVQVLAFRS